MEQLNSPHTEYRRGTLRRAQLETDPVAQFGTWFEEAKKSHRGDPHAVAVATADAAGHPSVRMVLLKSFDPAGFVFATNYQSRKGRELSENPHAALLFFWEDLEQQIRIEGKVEETSSEESDAIFADRPVASRIASLSSSQSEPIVSRAELEAVFAANSARFTTNPPQRPEHWGGFRLIPSRFEFWQGGLNRLHDRFEYVRADSEWRIQRLQP